MNTAIDIIKEEINRRIRANAKTAKDNRDRASELYKEQDFCTSAYARGYAESKDAENNYLAYLLKIIEKETRGE